MCGSGRSALSFIVIVSVAVILVGMCLECTYGDAGQPPSSFGSAIGIYFDVLLVGLLAMVMGSYTLRCSSDRKDSVDAPSCQRQTIASRCSVASNRDVGDYRVDAMKWTWLLQRISRMDDFIKASAELQRLLATNVKSEISPYNAVILACVKEQQIERAKMWLQKMRIDGIAPQTQTYNIILNVYTKRGKIEEAEAWYHQMRQDDISPSSVTYVSLIYCHAKAGDFSKAERWHDRMLEDGVEPNFHSFCAIIHACARAGDIDKAQSHLAHMTKLGISADVVVFGMLLHACSNAGDVQGAHWVFQQMQEQGIQPNIITYSTFARSLSLMGDWNGVEWLATELRVHGLAMNAYFLGELLHAYTNAGRRFDPRVEAAFRRGVAEGVELNKHVLTALGRALGRDRSEKLVKEVCGERALAMHLASRAPNPRKSSR